MTIYYTSPYDGAKVPAFKPVSGNSQFRSCGAKGDDIECDRVYMLIKGIHRGFACSPATQTNGQTEASPNETQSAFAATMLQISEAMTWCLAQTTK